MKIKVGDEVSLKCGITGLVNNTVLYLDMENRTYTKELHILTNKGILQKGVNYNQVKSINNEDCWYET